MLNPIQDMQPIELGQLNGKDHLGLTVHISAHPPITGRIVGIDHGYLTTCLKLRTQGKGQEYRADPESTIRIESHLSESGQQ